MALNHQRRSDKYWLRDLYGTLNNSFSRHMGGHFWILSNSCRPSIQKLTPIAIKPISSISTRLYLNRLISCTERLGIEHISDARVSLTLSNQQNQITLVGLHGCASWSAAFLLIAEQVSPQRGSVIKYVFYTKYHEKTYKYAIQHFFVEVLQYHLETKLKMLYPANIQSWATIGQPPKWRFAGGPIVASFYMFT